VLTRVAALGEEVKEMKRCPCYQGDDAYLHEEEVINVRCVEVLLQKSDGHEVHDASCDLYEEHLETHIVNLDRNQYRSYLSVHIQDLNEYERREGDSHNVCVGVVEHQDREHDDDGALER
jgi:hypothetical protein